MSRIVKVDAQIILTFPPQVKVTDEIVQVALFSCEQHLNSIGMINYNGPMLQTGTLSYGLRVHMGEPVRELKAVVLDLPQSKDAGSEGSSTSSPSGLGSKTGKGPIEDKKA